MSIDTVITQEFYEVGDATGPTTGNAGPRFPLGLEAALPPTNSDRILYYVSAGAAAATDGDVASGDVDQYTPAAGDESVTQYGNTGEMRWVYLKAGSDIRRGEPLVGQTTSDVVAPFTVVPSLATDDNASYKVVAVAQHNVASGKYFWALRKGVGVVATDGGVSDGDGLTLEIGGANAGTADSWAATASGSFGLALTDDGATASGFANVNSKTLVKAKVDCRG